MLAGAQFLAHPEHQEQPVVGAGAQDQDDHQVLRERRHLEPVLGRLGDQRPGDESRDEGRREGDQCQRQRAEDQHQQDNDQDRGIVLHLVARVAGCLLLINLNGDIPGQVHLQPGRQPGLRDLGSQRVDQVGCRVRVAAGLHREHHELLGVTVRRDPEVQDILDSGHRPQLALQRGHRRDIRWRQRRAGAGRQDRDRQQVGRAERRGQLRRVLARRAGRQEFGVIALSDAGKRRELRDRRECGDNPEQHHQPAEPDGITPDGAEDRVNVHGDTDSVIPSSSRRRPLRSPAYRPAWCRRPAAGGRDRTVGQRRLSRSRPGRARVNTLRTRAGHAARRRTPYLGITR